MSRIKFFVACHEETKLPNCKYLVPIQVGSALVKKHFENMLHDDDKENISEKNKMYCELTAQYWVWKNYLTETDYCGFFHYRRFLNFGKKLKTDFHSNIIFNGSPDDESIKQLGISDLSEDLIRKYDVIAPNKRRIYLDKNVYEHYIYSEGHQKEDLDRVLQILKNLYPEYTISADKYMKSKYAYECNMFVMKTSIFNEYAKWLFSILFKFEESSDFSNYSIQELRVIGYLGERLFGIWFTHNKSSLKCLEIQKALFKNRDKEGVQEIIENTDNSVITVMMMNKYTIVTTASIIKYARQERKYKLFILYKEINNTSKEELERLVQTDDRFSISFLCIGNKIDSYSKNLNVLNNVPIDSYYRFFIFEFFKNTDKVLYLDTDLIVKTDVAYLFDLNIDNYYVAAAKDADMIGFAHTYDNRKNYLLNQIGYKDINSYFQAGVLVFNVNKILKDYTVEDFFKIATSFKWKYMDQDVMNYMFKNQIFYFGQEYNCVTNIPNRLSSRLDIIKNCPAALYKEYLECRKNPKIIHYAGYLKPWNLPSMDMGYEFWKVSRDLEVYEFYLQDLSNEENLKKTKPKKLSLIKTFKHSIDEIGYKYTIKKAIGYLRMILRKKYMK